MAQRKTYSKEFKAETSGVTQVSQDLGIHPNMLYVWKKQQDKGAGKAFPGRDNPTDPELAQLRKDNARLKEEVEVLKKAAGIFLNRSGKDTQ